MCISDSRKGTALDTFATNYLTGLSYCKSAQMSHLVVVASEHRRQHGRLCMPRTQQNLNTLREAFSQILGNQNGVQLQPLVDALRETVLTHGVVHADETPVQMLMHGAKKTHHAYVWAYATSQLSKLAAVVYDFSPSRATGPS